MQWIHEAIDELYRLKYHDDNNYIYEFQEVFWDPQLWPELSMLAKLMVETFSDGSSDSPVFISIYDVDKLRDFLQLSLKS